MDLLTSFHRKIHESSTQYSLSELYSLFSEWEKKIPEHETDAEYMKWLKTFGRENIDIVDKHAYDSPDSLHYNQRDEDVQTFIDIMKDYVK